MKRVLHLSYVLHLAGTETVIMNWYRNIDRSKLQFDFIVISLDNAFFKDEIEKLGGKVILIEKGKGIFGKLKFLYRLYLEIKAQKYEIFQTHDHFFSGFSCMAAYFAGAKKRFTISHFSDGADKSANPVKKLISRLFINLFATDRLAVSQSAGKSLYGNISFETVNNGIDLENFAYNQGTRGRLRKELNLENKFVIGHVGRFEPVKNHLFLTDIFHEAHKKNKDAVLLLIGTGSQRDVIEQKVKKLALSENVKFLGLVNNVGDFYQVMDCFALPSLYEGFGIVAIEAQACGLPCFISNFVPDEANIVNSYKIPLAGGAQKWADSIIDNTKNYTRTDQTAKLRKAGFDIKSTADKIQKAYLE